MGFLARHQALHVPRRYVDLLGGGRLERRKRHARRHDVAPGRPFDDAVFFLRADVAPEVDVDTVDRRGEGGIVAQDQSVAPGRDAIIKDQFDRQQFALECVAHAVSLYSTKRYS